MSDEVKRNIGLTAYAVLLFSMLGMLTGIFWWPLLAVSFLVSLVAAAIWVLTGGLSEVFK